MITDRELLIAIFNAITGLSKRLTGEDLTVSVPTDEGARTLWIFGNEVRWSTASAEAAVGQSGLA
jgi:hypothetical protein